MIDYVECLLNVRDMNAAEARVKKGPYDDELLVQSVTAFLATALVPLKARNPNALRNVVNCPLSRYIVERCRSINFPHFPVPLDAVRSGGMFSSVRPQFMHSVAEIAEVYAGGQPGRTAGRPSALG